MRATRAPLPSDDKRWRIVETAMRRNGYRPDALIEALHSIQSSFGYLDEPGLRFAADSLAIAPSRVYGVATFYHFFKLKPGGKHVSTICTGTACYIKGAKTLLEAIEARYGIAENQTTDDGLLSLLTVRCVGACGLAPVVVLDDKVVGHVTTADIDSHLERMLTSNGADNNHNA